MLSFAEWKTKFDSGYTILLDLNRKNFKLRLTDDPKTRTNESESRAPIIGTSKIRTVDSPDSIHAEEKLFTRRKMLNAIATNRILPRVSAYAWRER